MNKNGSLTASFWEATKALKKEPDVNFPHSKHDILVRLGEYDEVKEKSASNIIQIK